MADESTWREIDLLRASLQSVSKAQNFCVHSLLVSLLIVWGWQSISPGGEVVVQVLGVSMRATGFWPIAPLVIALLNLSLIGAMNAMAPVWERIGTALTNAKMEMYWSDLDTNKNLLDYFAFLKIHPENPVQPKQPLSNGEQVRTHKLSVWLYPLLISWGIGTTLYSFWMLPHTNGYKFYVFGCFGVQILFFVRTFWNAFCRFFGIHFDKVRY
jgi:hypothetical protein